MDTTPKARNRFHLKVKQSDLGISHHSTPDASASKSPDTSSSDQFSPITSPSRYERLSQDIQVFWAWKSPEEVLHKKTGNGIKASCKNEATPSRCYSSPKPRRKLSSRNYSEKLQSLADELKLLTEGINLPGETTPSGNKFTAKEEGSGTVVRESSLGDSKQKVKDRRGVVNGVEQGSSGAVGVVGQGDVFIVELSPGDLSSLKSFPPDHQFPKVPKLELDVAMNTSDFTVLMEDNSIEEEVMRFTQQVEEELKNRKESGNEESCGTVPIARENHVGSVASKAINSVRSPRNVLKSPSVTALSRRSLSLVKKSPSPGKAPGTLNVAMPCTEGMEGIKKLGCVTEEEDVLGLLADDSLDDIMLGMEVQGGPKKPVSSDHRGKENVSSASPARGKTSLLAEEVVKDSLGMLEDDSLIQPDVLNFLDTVESQAIAASQPLKCTPEEIKLKMIEAKKKLAVGKRKRRSQMNALQPEGRVRSHSKY